MRARTLALGCALALVGLPTAAFGYCRTTTLPVPPDYAAEGCWSEGVPLYHPTACLPYRLLARESSVIPNAQLEEALGRAFATWLAPSATCTPGIAAIELAPVDREHIVEYRPGVHEDNIIGVPPSWLHHEADATLALTTVTFDPETGAIFDSDLELTPSVRWSFAPTPPSDGFDLVSTVTHEVGHMLGLAHAPDPSAAMYPSYSPGSIKERSLSPDDRAGVCAIYPSREVRSSASGLVATSACMLTPNSPDPGATCQADIFHGGCCSVPDSMHGEVDVVVLFGLVVLAREKRKRAPR